MRKPVRKIKLVQDIKKHEEEFLEIVRGEWSEVQKKAKKEELVRKAKHAAGATLETIFSVLAVSGICIVALAAPNVCVMYDKLSRKKVFLNKSGTTDRLNYMKRRNYVQLEKVEKNRYKVQLTEEGKAKMYLTLFNQMGKVTKKEWDKEWRMVAFDIPEKYKKARDGFRQKLHDLGFYQLQRSVFISPYKCEKELRLIISIFEIEQYVKIVEAEKVSTEDELKEIFRA